MSDTYVPCKNTRYAHTSGGTQYDYCLRCVHAGVPELEADLAAARLEVVGEQKANAILLAGLNDVCENRDVLKHRCRELDAELAAARARIAALEAGLAEAAVPLEAMLTAECIRWATPLAPSTREGVRIAVGIIRALLAPPTGG